MKKSLLPALIGAAVAVDGIYGVVALDGVKEHQFFNIDLEVEKDNK